MLLRQLNEVILKIFSTIFSKAMGSSEAIGFGHVGLAGMRGCGDFERWICCGWRRAVDRVLGGFCDLRGVKREVGIGIGLYVNRPFRDVFGGRILGVFGLVGVDGLRMVG